MSKKNLGEIDKKYLENNILPMLEGVEDKFELEKMKEFLRMYANKWSITLACAETGLEVGFIEYLREKYPKFDEAIVLMDELKTDMVEELFIKEAIFQRKNIIAMIHYLRAHRPEKWDIKRVLEITERKQIVLDVPPTLKLEPPTNVQAESTTNLET